MYMPYIPTYYISAAFHIVLALLTFAKLAIKHAQQRVCLPCQL